MDRFEDPRTRPEARRAMEALDEVLAEPVVVHRPTTATATSDAVGVLPDPELTLRGTQLIGPVWMWLAAVFALVYVGAEALFAPIIGGAFSTIGADLLTFGVMGALVAALLIALRPTVTVRERGHLAKPGPWVAASVGGLVVWGLTHNTVPWLTPLAAMDGLEAVSFLGVNVVEHTLIGMMLASFTRRPLVAFLLGGGFAAAVLAIWTWLVLVL